MANHLFFVESRPSRIILITSCSQIDSLKIIIYTTVASKASANEQATASLIHFPAQYHDLNAAVLLFTLTFFSWRLVGAPSNPQHQSSLQRLFATTSIISSEADCITAEPGSITKKRSYPYYHVVQLSLSSVGISRNS